MKWQCKAIIYKYKKYVKYINGNVRSSLYFVSKLVSKYLFGFVCSMGGGLLNKIWALLGN